MKTANAKKHKGFGLLAQSSNRIFAIMDKDYYSLTEVARTLGISRQAVHKRIKKNKLKAMKVGTTYIIAKDEVQKLKG